MSVGVHYLYNLQINYLLFFINNFKLRIFLTLFSKVLFMSVYFKEDIQKTLIKIALF